MGGLTKGSCFQICALPKLFLLGGFSTLLCTCGQLINITSVIVTMFDSCNVIVRIVYAMKNTYSEVY